ncbi:hypothetical protein BT96DRAFT_161079 [Gymnopus androsaceus JB14]|uniref:Uncharacterized protein n=1 Tax=Gymnopus androsaceus JB14 TaxID=1447944 RepID=A0A6A4HDJ6_9AGAR|nr:hypothetical protein BT96DRAFT_161079 [Gymnopus androsaceus JB14]
MLFLNGSSESILNHHQSFRAFAALFVRKWHKCTPPPSASFKPFTQHKTRVFGIAVVYCCYIQPLSTSSLHLSLHLPFPAMSYDEDPPAAAGPSGAFFAGAHAFDIYGAEFINTTGDMHSTITYDDSVKSDFSNRYGREFRGSRNNERNYYGGFRTYELLIDLSV